MIPAMLNAASDWSADQAALREGRRNAAVRHLKRALELNIPGYTSPALETRLRLKELGCEVLRVGRRHGATTRSNVKERPPPNAT